MSSKTAREAEIDMENILVNCPVVIWPGSEDAGQAAGVCVMLRAF